MGTITGHCHFTNITRRGNFPVLFPTTYPGIVPCVQCVPTVFRMNEYERRVGTWSDSQPRLLCVMLRGLYETLEQKVGPISDQSEETATSWGVAHFQDGQTNLLREALNLQHFLLLTLDIQVPQCT